MSAADDFDLSALAEIPDPAPKLGAPPQLAALPAHRPTRAVLGRRRTIALVAGGAWTVFAVWVLGLRHNLDAVSAVVHLALPLALGIVALVVAFTPGRLGLGPSASRAALLSIAGPLAFLVAAAVLRVQIPADDHRDTFGCGAYEIGVGAVPLILLGFALRGTYAVNGAWRSALVGAGLGLVWAGLWAIHCADSSTVHVLLAHGAPAVGLAAIGGFAVSRFTRIH
jgi:hypothetical protein